jgi:predicted permease
MRGWRRRPAFTLAVVLTLALGIGATTAIFSVVYSVLIKPLPYPNADDLVRIRHSAVNSADLPASTNMLLTYGQETRTFASIGLWQENSATVTDRGESERVRALRVSYGTLQALGVQPVRGRWFTEAEHGPADEGPPVILSHAFWQRRFGGDEAILERALTIETESGNGTLRWTGPSRVVGVMPPDFRFLDMTPQPEVIVAVRLDPARQAHGIYSWQMLARLKHGVTLTEARADLERMAPLWRDAWPPFPGTTREAFEASKITASVSSLQDDLVGGVASMIWVLMGAIGAVLLVACSNVANLMLVRADARRSELAVRAALGAVPARIARELLLESVVIGAAGAALGLLLAYVGLRILVALGPDNLPRLQEVAVHPPVLAFTLAVSLASVVAFGSITALKHAFLSDTRVIAATRGSTAGLERSRTRDTLVVVQVALALVLVIGAALMIRTFQALRDVDPGFADPATIQTAKIWLPTAQFRDPVQYTRLEREILENRGPSRRGFRGLRQRRSARVVRDVDSFRGRRPDAGGRRWTAPAREVRLAGLFRSDGHENAGRPRHDLERDRGRRPRGGRLRGLCSLACARAHRCARQTHPICRRVRSRRLAGGDRRSAEHPRGRLVLATAPHGVFVRLCRKQVQQRY